MNTQEEIVTQPVEPQAAGQPAIDLEAEYARIFEDREQPAADGGQSEAPPADAPGEKAPSGFVAKIRGMVDKLTGKDAAAEGAAQQTAAPPQAPASAPEAEAQQAPAAKPDSTGNLSKVLGVMRAGESPDLDDLAAALEEMAEAHRTLKAEAESLKSQLSERTSKVEEKIGKVDQAAQQRMAQVAAKMATDVAATLSDQMGEPIGYEEVLAVYVNNITEVSRRFPGKEMSPEAMQYAFKLEALAAGVELPSKARNAAPTIPSNGKPEGRGEESLEDQIAKIFDLR